MVQYDRLAHDEPLVSLCINSVLDTPWGAGEGVRWVGREVAEGTADGGMSPGNVEGAQGNPRGITAPATWQHS